MIDPILSLSFGIHSNKGVYALLAGSGVSRSAGIPTGWEIVLDLIRTLAHLKGEDCEPDPASWYNLAFGEEPDYDKVLDAVAKSSTERSQLLRGYFEPSEEEREQGLKLPTAAHKAIAELVQSGYIRVIVTTNFDRLMENALEAIGIAPIVISTPDAVEGAPPLTHLRCCIIKVNGDYLDTRIKNTPAELAHYDKRLNRLLDRIFDEFGLIVSGWSAEWDTALRAAVERCKNHRYTVYWTARHSIGELAQRLITLRRAQVINIQDADLFFRQLAEKVFAIDEISRPHPLSPKVAVASLKKYLVDDRYKISLHDLVMGETERIYWELRDQNFPVMGVALSKEVLLKRLQRYEALTEILIAMIVTGCYWGEKAHEYLWIKSLERIANPARSKSGTMLWLYLSLYPALLLLYAGGVAAISAGRYDYFSALLTKTRVKDENKDQPVVLSVYTHRVLKNDDAQLLPGMESRYTPLSDYLYRVLREALRDLLPDDVRYEYCFDRFEYLMALVHADLYEKQTGGLSALCGRFAWRARLYPKGSIKGEVDLEVKDAGPSWPLLRTGLFDGSVERFESIKRTLDERISKLHWL